MVKRRALDSSFLLHFRQRLQDGLAFGPLLANVVDLTGGTLSVWAPDALATIQPDDLQTDVFHGFHGGTEILREIGLYIASRINDRTEWLLLGETFHTPSSPPPNKDKIRFIWPVVASAVTPNDKYLGVCTVTPGIDWKRWEAFAKELKPYPSIAMIAKPPTSIELKPGEFPELAGEQLDDLLLSAQYILVGVFDDISMILWERHPKQATA
jgi:hypothetical protein